MDVHHSPGRLDQGILVLALPLNLPAHPAIATDALLSKLGLTMLEDDLSFFPPYYAVNFVDAELLESDPELAEVLSRLDGAIDEATMAAMNAQVDVDGMSAQEVAHQFLVEHGLVTE
ncbi:MAG: hypothetical protein KH446_10405 [Oscillibacter sp.]|nr:hypothetical protein [Oscillibacter sp.]